MDDAVAVVLPGVVVQGGLQAAGGLVKGGVADGVELDLEPGPVGLLAEVRDLFVVIVENALVVGTCVQKMENSIKNTCK